MLFRTVIAGSSYTIVIKGSSPKYVIIKEQNLIANLQMATSGAEVFVLGHDLP